MRNYVNILAKNIRAHLEKLERRPAWLAQKSGVEPSNISRLLKGEGNPTIGTISALAEALQVDLISLLQTKSKSASSASASNSKKDELLALIATIPDDRTVLFETIIGSVRGLLGESPANNSEPNRSDRKSGG